MYIIERRKETKDKILQSIEVTRAENIENNQFEDAIKKEIQNFIHYNFIDPDLKKSEILKVKMDDDTIYRWIMYDYQEDMAPFIFQASASQPDAFTDTVLNIMKKWKKEIAENGYTSFKKQEVKNSNYIIA